jgi:molybdopterin-guanine dinucleotide biosynthesis protein A
MISKTAGVVLAGGQSRRMGGPDKALLPFMGQSMIQRVVARLLPQVAEVAISSNGDPARFGGIEASIINDGIPGFAGPLAGISACLEWMRSQRPHLEWLVTVSVDCPFLPPDLAMTLHRASRGASLPIAFACCGGFIHPTMGLWSVETSKALRQAVESGERKIDRHAGRRGFACANWVAHPFDPFFNINTPSDLQAALSMATTLS